MNYSYVARQPILDCNRDTIGYELLFRDSPKNTFPEIEPELATSRLLSEHFLSTQYSTLGNKLGFVNFPYQSIVNLVPNLFPKKSLVIEILEDCQPTDELLSAIIKLHQSGYMIALDDFIPTQEWLRFLPYIHVIKFDIRLYSIEKASQFITQSQHYDIKFLAEKVETYAEFELAKKVGFNYFQGYFFSRPEMIQRRSLKSSFVSMIQLCQEMANNPINLTEIERLISLDMSLSYKLLAYVNSCISIDAKIDSFHQALVYLGEDRLRRFVSLITIASAENDKPSSLYGLALQRAKLCELLAKQAPKTQSPGQAFLTGMFSLLDSLLDKPLPELIDSIVLEQEIKHALLLKQGQLGSLLSLAIAYQRADWEQTRQLRQELQLSESQLVAAYNDATSWSEELLSKDIL